MYGTRSKNDAVAVNINCQYHLQHCPASKEILYYRRDLF